MTGVLGPLQTKWVQALESGEYKQTKLVLYDGVRHCCLGIACEVAGLKAVKTDRHAYLYAGRRADLPDRIRAYFGFRSDVGESTTGHCLAEMNDDGLSFTEIATIVRAAPENFFTEPK